MKTYTKKQIAERIPALTPRAIQFYTDEEVVRPLQMKPGRGNARLYSEENLREFAVIGRLAKMGMTISVIRKVIEAKPFSLEKFSEDVVENYTFDYSIIIIFQNGEPVYVYPYQSIKDGTENDGARCLSRMSMGILLAAGSEKLKHPHNYDGVIYIDISEVIRNL